MPRRKPPCPAEAVPGCECCAKGGGWFSIVCRGCVVRWIANMPKDDRLFYIGRIKDEHGAAAGESLHAAVRTYIFERNSSQKAGCILRSPASQSCQPRSEQ